MLNGLVNNMRKDRAEFACNVEYLKEAAIANDVDDRTEVAESQYFTDTIEELEEAATWIGMIDTSKEDAIMQEEVNKVLDSEEDMTFSELIGG